jgi:hypothetical protein
MNNALSISARTLNRLRPAHWTLALLIGGAVSAFGAGAANLEPGIQRTDAAVEIATASTAVADDSTALVDSVVSDTAAAGVETQASAEAALH